MAFINWSENLSVKIGSIDNQHKKLVEHINAFYDSVAQGSSKEKTLELIKAMKNYTVSHFTSEENIMKQYNYPAFSAHKVEHDKFVAKVLDFEDRFKSGKLLLSIEITNFIKDWLTSHIMGTDKKYSDFLLKNGVK
jgi:hemerythrin-like metal-binding protein